MTRFKCCHCNSPVMLTLLALVVCTCTWTGVPADIPTYRGTWVGVTAMVGSVLLVLCTWTVAVEVIAGLPRSVATTTRL